MSGSIQWERSHPALGYGVPGGDPFTKSFVPSESETRMLNAVSREGEEAELPEVVRTGLALGSGYRIAVRSEGGETLELQAPDGRVCLRVRLHPDGPAVELEAASLSIAARGELRLGAQDVSLVAERSLAISAGGELTVASEQSLTLRGRDQHLESTHGDIHIDANDDVRVDGERVRLNAPEAAPLRRR